ncbi:complex I subunit 5 family protein [Salinibaculum salinum]|uniref:complex I subunit 5 family protein n=1 Tax=Salinibaculum salinum TaxID=3131996 RepID=UPI0030EC0284
MTDILVLAPLVIALATGALTLVVRRWPRVQRVTSVAGVLAYASAVAAIAWTVVFRPDATALGYQVGGWQAPFGITLVADALAAFMLVLTAVVALYAVAFSVLFIDLDNQRVYYHPLFQFMLLGMTGAFLTGDLFNLFVWFEVMLMSSYVFVAFYGNATHTAAAVRYVVLNTVGSVLMLLAIGGLYATLGTLNMADMAVQLADPSLDGAPVVGFTGLLLATFALKAGLVPFQFWVPSAYQAAPLPVSAVLAGAAKKVGIYAIVRVYFTVFSGASVTTTVPFVPVESPLAYLAPVLLVMGIASTLLGGLGAVSRDRIEGVLAYSSLGQVGFIAIPIAIAAGTSSASLRHLGILAALIYAFHHALAKGLLFLAAGAIRDAAGTTAMAELGGLGERSQLFSVTVLVGSLSLVGIPPLTGFFGKLLVFEVGAAQYAETPTAGSAALIGVLLAGAVLTIVYMTRVWVGGFWGSQTARVETATVDPRQVGLLATLAALVVLVGIGFDPLYRFAEAAATAAIDTDAYVDIVRMGGEP